MNDPTTESNDEGIAAQRPSSGSGAAWLLLGFSLMVPSLTTVERYSGSLGVVGYVLVAAAALAAVKRFGGRLLEGLRSCSDRQVRALIAATFAGLAVAFAVIYPIANVSEGRAGSDGDDAIEVATGELLAGRYPYRLHTYLDNPISPLPGALVLAIPFVLTGVGAIQNLFWLAAFLLTLRWHLADARVALLIFWLALALSPGLWWSYAIGSDHIANGIYVLVFMAWLVACAERPGALGALAVPAVLLGVGLASRANFAMLAPLVLAALVRARGWLPALAVTGLCGLCCLLLILPFWWWDPAGFSPLRTSGKLGRFDALLPGLSLAIPAVTGLAAVWLALSRGRGFSIGGVTGLFGRSAAVLALPIVIAVVLDSVAAGRVDVGFAFYGVFFLFFGVLAAAKDLAIDAARAPSGAFPFARSI